MKKYFSIRYLPSLYFILSLYISTALAEKPNTLVTCDPLIGEIKQKPHYEASIKILTANGTLEPIGFVTNELAHWSYNNKRQQDEESFKQSIHTFFGGSIKNVRQYITQTSELKPYYREPILIEGGGGFYGNWKIVSLAKQGEPYGENNSWLANGTWYIAKENKLIVLKNYILKNCKPSDIK